MDKQKQIEEMAKELQRLYEKYGFFDFEWFAEDLQKLGYRKIPENAVVLDEAEYSDILTDEVETIRRDILEYWATEDVDIVAKELHKDGYRKLDDHAILVLRKAKGLEEKVRKETAEKFAERLKALGDDGVICHLLFNEIDEICMEITEV